MKLSSSSTSSTSTSKVTVTVLLVVFLTITMSTTLTSAFIHPSTRSSTTSIAFLPSATTTTTETTETTETTTTTKSQHSRHHHSVLNMAKRKRRLSFTDTVKMDDEDLTIDFGVIEGDNGDEPYLDLYEKGIRATQETLTKFAGFFRMHHIYKAMTIQDTNNDDTTDNDTDNDNKKKKKKKKNNKSKDKNKNNNNNNNDNEETKEHTLYNYDYYQEVLKTRRTEPEFSLILDRDPLTEVVLTDSYFTFRPVTQEHVPTTTPGTDIPDPTQTLKDAGYHVLAKGSGTDYFRDPKQTGIKYVEYCTQEAFKQCVDPFVQLVNDNHKHNIFGPKTRLIFNIAGGTGLLGIGMYETIQLFLKAVSAEHNNPKFKNDPTQMFQSVQFNTASDKHLPFEKLTVLVLAQPEPDQEILNVVQKYNNYTGTEYEFFDESQYDDGFYTEFKEDDDPDFDDAEANLYLPQTGLLPGFQQAISEGEIYYAADHDRYFFLQFDDIVTNPFNYTQFPEGFESPQPFL